MKRERGTDTFIRRFKTAVSLWQKDIRLINGVHRIECFSLGKSVVVVHDYPNGDGWAAYTAVLDNTIDGTFAAIAAQCGVE